MKKIHRYVKIMLSASIIFILISAGTNKSIELFNGIDLRNWYAYTPATGRINNAMKIFKVENGEIKLQGKASGYIATNESFKNFDLKLEFSWETDTTIPRKSRIRNSGVMYYVPPDSADALWPEGIQFQVKQNHTGDFILLHNTTLKVRGTVYGPGKSVVVPRLTDAEKKPGEWNTIEIISENGKCTQLLNGKIVNEGEDASVTSGRIVLLYEGYPIKFRNIEIEVKN